MKKTVKTLWLIPFFLIFGTTTLVVASENTIHILVPGTPSSIPFIIASANTPGIEVKVIHNRSQAHANFLRGDADLVVTGLSVGLKFFDQNIPVKIVSSHVISLTYLVFNSNLIPNVGSFSDLVGLKIRYPFPGSPIEEVSTYFINQEGLSPQDNLQVGYGDFQSSVKLLKGGQIAAVPLPEPFVSMALKDTPFIKLGPSYSTLWKDYNQSTYPQVTLLGKSTWLDKNQKLLQSFEKELQKAIALCKSNPEKAVEVSKDSFTLPQDLLLSALNRTEFAYKTGAELQNSIFNYYKITGKRLDEKYNKLF